MSQSTQIDCFNRAFVPIFDLRYFFF
jgi:hypothetical protein